MGNREDSYASLEDNTRGFLLIGGGRICTVQNFIQILLQHLMNVDLSCSCPSILQAETFVFCNSYMWVPRPHHSAKVKHTTHTCSRSTVTLFRTAKKVCVLGVYIFRDVQDMQYCMVLHLGWVSTPRA